MMEQDNELSVNEAVLDYKRHYTYSDYMKWDDDQRWELIDGIAYLMSAPSVRHQEILLNLSLLFGSFLKGKSCKAYFAPFDVRLSADTTDDTVVQPDLVIICDKSIIMDTGCKGVPDMVIEILSPSTSLRDKAVKFDLYLKKGVREYWIVDPDPKTELVHTHILDNGRYYARCYTKDDVVPVHVIDGCEIALAEVFTEE
ncbi:MAG: Uma2 family endonuclease [Oscillospiraceae bacterium]|jgi:Uma2 family endonuclease|nr:Uma2 family endonuclease [Oscillospiraceae bacterium]